MDFNHSRWYGWIIVAVLVIVVIILCVFVVRQYNILDRREIISAERLTFATIARHHSLGAADAYLIEPWMTFDYISISFKVPTSYFTQTFGISSSSVPAYPNITLARYARTVATSSDVFTDAVRTAVERYLQ